MQMTHKADLLTEGIVKKLNLLIAADQLTGYALTVRAPGEQERKEDVLWRSESMRAASAISAR